MGYAGEKDAASIQRFINGAKTKKEMDAAISVLRAYRVPQAWVDIALKVRGTL